MSWSNRGTEQRVGNPFGGTQSQSGGFGAFGAFGSQPSNPFQQPQRLNVAMHNQGPREGKGKMKGQLPSSGNGSMQEDISDSPKARVSNPFAAVSGGPKQSLSLQEAITQYKSENLRKKGYPFSCFGLPDEPPVLSGDVSPEELRFYMSQGNEAVQKAISERSNLLNEDFGDFLRWANPEGNLFNIKRSGPYRVADPEFPLFVPRVQFSITGSTMPTPSQADLDIFKTRSFGDGSRIPLAPPPLELR